MAAVSKAQKVMMSKSVVLLRRPHGMPSPKLGEDIGIKETQAPLEAPEGGLLVKLHFVSVDPYLRNRMATGLNPNDVIAGFVSGKVIDSKAADWATGDLFGANLPFTSYQTVSSKDLAGFRKLNKYLSEDELSLGIGLLGMPGSTAYAALDLMQVNENDSVWISAATGAVGAVAGQIAKNVKKCKLVLGSAGSDEKCHVAETDFSYDKCFNYKEAKNATELSALVKKNAPGGIDFYFENVGGDHFTAALSNMRVKGRIAVCGAISRYNHTESSFPSESLSLGQIIYSQIRIEGFLCGDWLAGKRGNFLEDMSRWHREGLVKKRETEYRGIEAWPEAFHALFTQGGDNLGKIVVRVDV